jgi:hypothetical protein
MRGGWEGAPRVRHNLFCGLALVSPLQSPQMSQSFLWSETGEAGTYEFWRRLVFSVLIGNADMHFKNWSLLYPDRRTPVLSPAYDFVSIIPYIQSDELALSFGGSRSLREITPDQVRRFAILPACPQALYGGSLPKPQSEPWQAGRSLLKRICFLRRCADRSAIKYSPRQKLYYATIDYGFPYPFVGCLPGFTQPGSRNRHKNARVGADLMPLP